MTVLVGEGDGPVLRFGFSYGHVRALAWCAVRGHFAAGWLDREERFEAAWGAVVEHLYAASEPPTSLDLVVAGRRGLDRLRRGVLRERGFAFGNDGHRDVATGSWSAPSFWRYWQPPAPSAPEDAAVDRTALGQIMAALTPVQAQALLALADHGDYESAAAALGIPYATFSTRVRRAREAFLALWHEHEAPSRTWRHDKRVTRPAPRSQPASHADAVTVLSGIREAFGGHARVASLDLLARLAAADPGRYRDWEPADLACFLRRYAVPRRRIEFPGGPGHGGRRRSRWGYRLEEVTAALTELTAPGEPAGQAA